MPDPTNTSVIDLAEILAIDEEVRRRTGSERFGVTEGGFVPKSFGQLVGEKVALAQQVFGADLDLTSGSVMRKLLELTALEDARTWSALAATYDNQFVTTASGAALTHLGQELGLARPRECATGAIDLELVGTLVAPFESVFIPRGARLLTEGGHHVALDESVRVSASAPSATVGVRAFYPGPEHNLDPGVAGQRIDRWNVLSDHLEELSAATEASAPGSPLEAMVSITHTRPLEGGERSWSDARYRELLLRAPRSIWTVEAVEVALGLVPGVRAVRVRDGWGGLDLRQSIFGNFNFIERVFGSERDLGSPYYFGVLVAPTASAIWGGPDGLRAALEDAMEDIRPIGIYARVERAEDVGVGVAADLSVEGIPMPSGSLATMNASESAKALKGRLLERVRRYLSGLSFGEPVRAAEVTWALMNEPGIRDAQNLRLYRYPPGFDAVDLGSPVPSSSVELLGCQENLELASNQIPVLIDDDSRLQIVRRHG